MWLLVVYYAVYAGTMPLTQDFPTQAQCEQARALLIQDEKDWKGMWGPTITKSKCVQIGDKNG